MNMALLVALVGDDVQRVDTAGRRWHAGGVAVQQGVAAWQNPTQRRRATWGLARAVVPVISADRRRRRCLSGW